jgi:hypothetical protein
MFRLDRGLLAPAPSGAWPGGSGLDIWLEVEADAPRALVSALAQHPDVHELGYAENGTGRVRVRGAELERLAEAVARAALNAHIDIRSLRVVSDDLEVGRALATGRAHAAYRAAQAPRRAANPAAPAVAAPETPGVGPTPPDPSP